MRNDFNYTPLTELLTCIVDNRGKTVPTEEMGFPLIATNCIKLSSIYPTFDKVRFVSENTLKNWFRAHLQPNDILFVNKGTPGRVCLVPDPVTFCAAQDMMAFRTNNDRIYYKYLFAALRSEWIQKKIENFHVGLVIPHFKKQDLDNILIPELPYLDQKFIGDLYVGLSEKIELNNKINSELESMAKLIYDYWFVQFDFPNENGKPYKSSGGKMVWNEKLKREIPEGWEGDDLGTLIDLNYGKALKSDIRSGSGFPVVGSSGVVGFHSEYLVEGPGIVIGRKGTIGKVTYLEEKFFPIDTAYFVKPKIDIEFSFLYFLLNGINFSTMNTDSAVPGLNRDRAYSVPISIPPCALIQQFEVKVKSTFAMIRNLKVQNESVVSLRDWLLPMLMNGQVRVSEGSELSISIPETEGVANYNSAK